MAGRKGVGRRGGQGEERQGHGATVLFCCTAGFSLLVCRFDTSWLTSPRIEHIIIVQLHSRTGHTVGVNLGMSVSSRDLLHARRTVQQGKRALSHPRTQE